MKIKYELIIYWSEVDQAFIVEVSVQGVIREKLSQAGVNLVG